MASDPSADPTVPTPPSASTGTPGPEVEAAISPVRGPESLPYPPLRCKPPCSELLNPFARVDFAAKIWICPICFSRNHFPPHYADISEQNVPAELFPQCSTAEYLKTICER